MVACSEGNTTDFLGLVLRYERGEEGKTTCVFVLFLFLPASPPPVERLNGLVGPPNKVPNAYACTTEMFVVQD